MPESYEIISYELVDIGHSIENATSQIQAENPSSKVNLLEVGNGEWMLYVDDHLLLLQVQVPSVLAPDLTPALFGATSTNKILSTDDSDPKQAEDEPEEAQAHMNYSEYELCLQNGSFKWFDEAAAAGLRSAEIVNLWVKKLLEVSFSRPSLA